MVQILSSVVALLAASIAVATPVRRDVPTVEADIAAITTQLKSLDSLIDNYPSSGGTLAGALAIHNSAVSLITSLQKAVTDANATPGPVSEDDGNTILSSIQADQPIIADALTVIVQKKPAFQALPLGGVPTLIFQDLNNLSGNTTAFANVLIDKAPEDLKPTATTIRDDIAAAFATAIAAYAP